MIKIKRETQGPFKLATFCINQACTAHNAFYIFLQIVTVPEDVIVGTNLPEDEQFFVESCLGVKL